MAAVDELVISSSPSPEWIHPERPHSLRHQTKPKGVRNEPKAITQKKRHGARNQHRHKFFVRWLLERFDLEESRSIAQTATVAGLASGAAWRANTAAGEHRSNGVDHSDGSVGDYAADNGMAITTCDTKDGNSSDIQSSSSALASSRQRPKLHILDVAGGKGEVSARLTMCHQQRVIMVDPRPANIVDCYERIVLPKIPKKWRQRLEDQRATNPNFVRDIIESRFEQFVTTFDDKIMMDSLPPNSRPELRQQLIELQSTIQNATLIIGLHADGATEAIVDAALKYHKPFVVVPCCVFPNFFPMRRVLADRNDGKPPKMVPVRTHEQFCTYLLRKDPRFVMEELPFEGRNIAIWWNGK